MQIIHNYTKLFNANQLNLIIPTKQEYISDQISWMTKNKLQLNESKTEFELFRKPSDLQKIENSVIEIKSD